MSFDIGQRVVCVDVSGLFKWKGLYLSFPVRGAEYTIRDVQLGIEPDCHTGAVSVLLEGIVNPKANSRAALERGFDARRFMPVEDVPVTENWEDVVKK